MLLTNVSRTAVKQIEGEFWPAKQRQMHSLHYCISYRGSFKPELPDFFIKKYTKPGDIVADPFCGRGTTALQANLLGRVAWANDANPLAVAITYAKANPVMPDIVEAFLDRINWDKQCSLSGNEDLLAFYHPRTLQELLLLRKHIQQTGDDIAKFVQLLALSRLHGHSKGFFSAYSMPQVAISSPAQEKINRKRGEVPEYRPLIPRILAKAKSALRDGLIDEIKRASRHNLYVNADATRLTLYPSGSVDLVVTSPPFLNKVNYLQDNWLEHWFLEVDAEDLKNRIMQTASLPAWQEFIGEGLLEMARILRRGGICVIEVGDICHRRVRINLDEIVCNVLAENKAIRLRPVSVLIQTQQFTKLAHCFNVTNNMQGTNTQRMLILEKK
jgi:hypothetical protein